MKKPYPIALSEAPPPWPQGRGPNYWVVWHDLERRLSHEEAVVAWALCRVDEVTATGLLLQDPNTPNEILPVVLVDGVAVPILVGSTHKTWGTCHGVVAGEYSVVQNEVRNQLERLLWQIDRPAWAYESNAMV